MDVWWFWCCGEQKHLRSTVRFHTWTFSSSHRRTSPFSALLWSRCGYRCRQWHVRFNPQQRISDHLFPPSGDHKTLTRICANFARAGSLVCVSGFCCGLSSSLLFPSLSPRVLCVALHLPGHLSPRPSKQSSGRWKVWECRVYGPAERGSHDYPTDVSARVEWNRSCCSDEAASCHPLLFDLNFSSDQSENESVENERNIVNWNQLKFFFFYVQHANCWLWLFCEFW